MTFLRRLNPWVKGTPTQKIALAYLVIQGHSLKAAARVAGINRIAAYRWARDGFALREIQEVTDAEFEQPEAIRFTVKNTGPDFELVRRVMERWKA